MERTEGHHLNILPVKSDPYVFPLGDRFDKALVELPRHVGDDDAGIGRHAFEDASRPRFVGLICAHSHDALDLPR
jgi:hypothetical protein